MMENPDGVKQFSPEKFSVQSQSISQIHYIVSKTGNGLVCECPDHIKRRSDCKHIKSVLEFIKKNQGDIQDFRMMDQSLLNKCKFCSSGKLVKCGIRKNKKGNSQRYLCQDCKKRFVLNLGFEKMKTNDVLITRALQMYFSGMSVRDVADCLEQEENGVNASTMYRWLEKYSQMIGDYVKGIVPRVSEVWRTDEIFMRISG